MIKIKNPKSLEHLLTADLKYIIHKNHSAQESSIRYILTLEETSRYKHFLLLIAGKKGMYFGIYFDFPDPDIVKA